MKDEGADSCTRTNWGAGSPTHSTLWQNPSQVPRYSRLLVRFQESRQCQDRPTNCTFGGPELSDLYISSIEGHTLVVRDTGMKGYLLYPN